MTSPAACASRKPRSSLSNRFELTGDARELQDPLGLVGPGPKELEGVPAERVALTERQEPAHVTRNAELAGRGDERWRPRGLRGDGDDRRGPGRKQPAGDERCAPHASAPSSSGDRRRSSVPARTRRAPAGRAAAPASGAPVSGGGGVAGRGSRSRETRRSRDPSTMIERAPRAAAPRRRAAPGIRPHPEARRSLDSSDTSIPAEMRPARHSSSPSSTTARLTPCGRTKRGSTRWRLTRAGS